MSSLIELRWHGRGGQGVVSANMLLANALILEGKYVQAFPEFGPERSGAPVKGFLRVSDGPIDLHQQIYEPDIILCIDPALSNSPMIVDGLKPNGCVIVNSTKEKKEVKKFLGIAESTRLYVLDAVHIAQEIFGRPFYNTPMMGALSKITELVQMESLKKAMGNRFTDAMLEKNIKALERGYEEVK